MANKYDYLLIVQGYWENSWADETAETDKGEALARLREYRKACPGRAFRIIHRRELRSSDAS